MRPQCIHCQTTFCSTGNLTLHLKRKHGISNNNICECGTHFEKSQSLNAHYRHCLIHRGGKPVIPPGNKGVPSPYRGLTAVDRYGVDRALEISAKISVANAGQSHPHTIESKRKLSLKRIEHLETSPHVKWFDVGGIRVQGSWEKMLAEEFISADLEIKRVRLHYDGHRHYTPDFYLPALDLYVEVKGWMSDRDKAKYKKVLIEHSDKTIKLLTGRKNVLDFDVRELQSLPDLKDTI